MARMSDAAKLKLAIGREKVRAAIEADGGTTVYAAHLLPHTAPWLPGVLASGVRMLEITHGSIYFTQHPARRDVAFGGRYETLMASYGVPTSELAAAIARLRPALGSDIFLNVAAAGTFNQIGPARFDEEAAFALSQAGADGIHFHKSDVDELEELVRIAHAAGMTAESYVHRDLGPTHPFSYMGLPAETPREVGAAVKALEKIGVDIVGIMFSVDPEYYSQVGATDRLPGDVRRRVKALVDAATGFTSVEGQITEGNARELRKLGANILVLGTQFDLAIQEAIGRVVREFSGRPPARRSPE
jgi:pentose-5-phosphate-3-epimerase